MSMDDFYNCPCSGGTLDKLIQPAILAVLSEEPSHGYRIAEKIGEMPGFDGVKPDVSGVYRFLKSMETKGLVVSSWDMPGKGHAKRLYEVTTAGEACLARWVETLDGYRKTISTLLKAARAAVSNQPAKKARQPARRAKRAVAAR
jgi:PadR family transcriptional regulator, regulatory protein PadR